MLKTSFNEEPWVLCTCDKEELKTGHIFWPWGLADVLSSLWISCVRCSFCAVCAAVLWSSLRWEVGESYGWSMKFNIRVPPVSSLSVQQELLCNVVIEYVPQESSREHPCTHSSLSPSAAAEGLSPVSVPGHSFKLCFLSVEVLA